ncbi:T9SS type A sorting domain-containing protein [bacterium]|nr:T9SS type A sorting domain-containing protein [bacterium]MBU1937658.1 T9SS type A sorting domain-containing protein [bacterium]
MTFQKVFSFAVILFLPFCAQGTIYRVPFDYGTIQEAIDASHSGDTVMVDPDTYSENLVIENRAITLGSLYLITNDTSYISQTIIDGSEATNPDSASTIYIHNQSDTLSRLVGLTIAGGLGMITEEFPADVLGGGITARWSNVLIDYCYIIDNGTVFSGGGLVAIGGDVSIQHSRFEANSAGYGSAFTAAFGYIECIDVDICHHTEYWELCWVDSADFLIRNCRIFENVMEGNASFTTAWSHGQFVNNQVYRNIGYGVNSGCIVFFEGAEVNIDSNEVWENEATYGAFIFGGAGLCSLRWNNIHDNTGYESGGGIHTSVSSFHYLYQNSFIHNVGRYGGAIYAAGVAQLRLTENYFEGNEATEPGWAGAIACVQPWNIIMRRNVIVDNDSLAIGGEILNDMYHNPVDAVENYWGDPSGPYHPILNPDGLGNAVDDSVFFIPWLTEPPAAIDKPQTPAQIPQDFALLSPYPNPFNPGVTLPLEIHKPGEYKIEIYDLLGRLVWSKTESFTSGNVAHIYWPGVSFDGHPVSAGIYFARASLEYKTSPARKLVLLK